MSINKNYIVIGLIVAFTVFFELAAHADERDQATRITFSAPVQIPGHVLPAGTYVFQLADPDAAQNIVQIFNADRTHLYATLLTVATERPDRASDTEVTLAEQGAGRPDALLEWFYPGNVIGSEFLYSGPEEKELARDQQQMVVANHQATSNTEAAGAGN